ncbi:hypothetical protein D7B24_007077 [Verticillium nonalfalfae]|uniref:RING-type domain-containing protein n=1 Tax=Verticillium nonalfalfae TaxID=1051616 RepID=A0A3M9YBZ4_9PEZI|nr:uncharacterized protein D7B24_007077 [Verticillium nonalfalfae]RNJ56590.1 hypothetical protein D7B24_007077 [Verticillium nonalfalfae]
MQSVSPQFETAWVLPPPPPSSSHASTETTDADCSICYEQVGRVKPEGTIESWLHFPCGHRFGSLCLLNWLFADTVTKFDCPMCRRLLHWECGHLAVPSPAPFSRKEVAWYAAEPRRPLPGPCEFCQEWYKAGFRERMERRSKKVMRLLRDRKASVLQAILVRARVERDYRDDVWRHWYTERLDEALMDGDVLWPPKRGPARRK